MRLRPVSGPIALLLTLVCAGMPARADDIAVFAAASLKTALDKIAPDYKAKSGDTIVPVYASSGTLAKQIESGAPADLFVSADEEWMDQLAGKQLLVEGTRKDLLGNTLVVVASTVSTLTTAFPLPKTLGAGRIAIADPASVPAGKYAKAALTSMGQWAEIEPKATNAENVRAALAQVARGEAPLGIVYGSDAKSEPQVKVLDIFPANSHPPILYPAALLKGAAHQAAAAKLLAYLAGPEAGGVFTEAGFTLAARP